MRIHEFKSLVSGAPIMPLGLSDDALLEAYLIHVFSHAARVQDAIGGDAWRFYIDQTGSVRGEVKIPQAIDPTFNP